MDDTMREVHMHFLLLCFHQGYSYDLQRDAEGGLLFCVRDCAVEATWKEEWPVRLTARREQGPGEIG